MSPLLINIGVISISGVLAIVGAALIKIGFWPRRRGQTPHCRGCGYALVGNESGSCPECGKPVSDANIVRGERERRRGLAASGVATLLLGLAIVAGSWARKLSSEDWYRIWPSAWLVKDVTSSDYERAASSWAELSRRRNAGELAEKYEAKLTEIALQEQARTGPGFISDELMDYLGERFLAERMTAQQAERFFTQGTRAKIEVRPIVALGDAIPVALTIKGKGPHPRGVFGAAPRPQWGCRITCDKIRIGDQEQRWRSGIGSPAFLGTTTLRAQIDALREGTFKVQGLYHIDIFYPWGPHASDEKLRWSRDFVLHGQVQILPTGSNPLQVIDDPQLAAVIKNLIQIRSIHRYSSQPGEIQIQLKVDEMPIDLAFKVSARAGGKGLLMQFGDELTLAKGQRKDFFQINLVDVPPEVTKFDLIFSGDKDAARKTLDVYQVWTGQILLEDLKVQD